MRRLFGEAIPDVLSAMGASRPDRFIDSSGWPRLPQSSASSVVEECRGARFGEDGVAVELRLQALRRRRAKRAVRWRTGSATGQRRGLDGTPYWLSTNS